MGSNLLVQIKDLRKTYKVGNIQYEVLRGIDLEIRKGDFLAIIGPSGSGKTTLLNILGLLDKPTSGSFFFEGRDVSKLSPKELAHLRNQKIGFIFQAFHLISWSTALENVLLPLVYRNKGKIEEEDIKRAKSLLIRLGLEKYIHFKPSELSGGQQQRVAIARALINNPSLLLADEPTGNLDSHASNEVIKILEELNQENLTIVLVTHDLEIAKRAKTIKLLRDGVFVKE